MRHSASAFALAFLACASINAQPRDPYNWTAVGPMGTARADACAVLLQDGRALVIGGIGSDGSALSSAELFNTDQTFSPAPSLNTARAKAGELNAYSHELEAQADKTLTQHQVDVLMTLAKTLY